MTRYKVLNVLRRALQLSVLLALVAIPILSRYEVLRNQRDFSPR